MTDGTQGSRPVPKIAEMAKQARKVGAGGKADQTRADHWGDRAHSGDRARAAKSKSELAAAGTPPELSTGQSASLKPLMAGVGIIFAGAVAWMLIDDGGPEVQEPSPVPVERFERPKRESAAAQQAAALRQRVKAAEEASRRAKEAAEEAKRRREILEARQAEERRQAADLLRQQEAEREAALAEAKEAERQALQARLAEERRRAAELAKQREEAREAELAAQREAERQAAERAEQARQQAVAAAKAEAERKAKQEAERLAREEAERLEREAAEARAVAEAQADVEREATQGPPVAAAATSGETQDVTEVFKQAKPGVRSNAGGVDAAEPEGGFTSDPCKGPQAAFLSTCRNR
jgi:hypothetical protein